MMYQTGNALSRLFILSSLLILFASTGSQAQHKRVYIRRPAGDTLPDFNYSLLSRGEPQFGKTAPDSAVYFRKREIKRKGKYNTEILTRYAGPYGISTKTYKDADEEEPYCFRASLRLKNHGFSVDSLYYGAQYRQHRPLNTMIDGVYHFSYAGRDYAALYLYDMSYNCTRCDALILLFDVSGEPQYIPLMFQASDDLSCFGDFNNDGQLDFAFSNEGVSAKVECYTLSGNTFVKIPDKYVALLHTGLADKILPAESKWFFALP